MVRPINLFKKFFLTLSCILALGLIFLSFLPTILSSPWGARLLPKEIQASKISLSWTRSQEIQGLSLYLPEAGMNLSCENLRSDASLFRILFFQDVKNLEIKSPLLTCYAPSQEVLHFEKASLEFPTKDFFKRSVFAPQGNICISQGEIRFADKEGLVFKNIEANLSFKKKAQTGSLSLNSDLWVGETPGKIRCETTFHHLFSEGRQAALSLFVQELPLEAIDTLKAGLGFYPDFSLKNLCGPILNLELSGTYAAANGNIKFHIVSENIDAQGQAALEPSAFTLLPMDFNLHLSPSLANQLLANSELLLAQGAEVHIQELQGRFPFASLSTLGLEGNFSLEAPQITYQGRTLEGSHLRGSFQKERFVNAIGGNLEAVSSFNNESFSLSASWHFTGALQDSLFSLEIAKAPLEFFQKDSAELLGSPLSANLYLQPTENGPRIAFSFSTPNLQIENGSLLATDLWTLENPIKFTYQKPKTVSIEGTLEDLNFPRNFVMYEMRAHISALLTSSWGVLQPVKAQLDVQTLKEVSLGLFGPGVRLDSSICISKDLQKLEVSKPIRLDLLLTPSLFDALLKSTPYRFKLANEANLEIAVDPFSFPFQDMPALNLSAQIPILELYDAGNTLFIKEEMLKAHLDLSKNRVSFELIAQVQEKGKQEGSLEVRGNLQDSSAYLECKTASLPTSFIGLFTSLNTPLTSLLSPTISGECKLSLKDNEDTLCIHMQSDTVSLDTELLIKDHKLVCKTPLAAQLHLSPEGFKVLGEILTHKAAAPYSLNKPCKVSVEVESLTIPIQKQPTLSLKRWKLLSPYFWDMKASINTPLFSFTQTKSSQEVILEGSTLHVTTGSQGSLNVEAHADIISIDRTVSQEGSIAVNMACQDFFAEKGGYNHAKLTAKLDAVPSVLLDMAAYYSNSSFAFQEVLGSNFNADISLDIDNASGPIDISMYTKHHHLFVAAALKNGTLTLKESLLAQVLLTPKMARAFLSNFGIESLETSQPVTLTIDPVGFSLPVFPYDPQNFHLSMARLELGKVSCKSNESLSVALGLLRSGEDSLSLWFTPLDFSVDNGVLCLSRSDILVNEQFQLALWGKANLVKPSVDMVLGLTASALDEAFNIRNLPDDYVMQIPIKGPLKNMQIDGKKAAGKIAAILAMQQGGDIAESFGGTAGNIIGGFLKGMKTLPDADKVAPAAKDPLPWDLAKPTPTSSDKNEKKRAIHSSDSPLKQLLKILF